MVIVLGKVFVGGHRLGYVFLSEVFFSLSYMDSWFIRIQVLWYILRCFALISL